MLTNNSDSVLIQDRATRPGELDAPRSYSVQENIRPTVVVVDDQREILDLLESVLEEIDCNVYTYTDPYRVLDGMARHGADVLLTDMELPGMDGLSLLDTVRRRWPHCKVVVFTGYGRVELAVRALKMGATDFLTKPLNCCTLPDMVRQFLSLRPTAKTFGGSPEIHALVASAAPTTCSILITGESGTGKEVLADYIHANSKRNDKPYIKVNCSALSETLIESELFGHEQGAFTGANRRHTGRFERAQLGTIFLDEIAELSLAMQTKLLRVLQNQEIERVGGSAPIKLDFRLISATHRNLEQMVAEGKFRQDLFFRINTVPIRLPALRERPNEIPYLAELFIEKSRAKMGHSRNGISTEALSLLRSYTWPGNIRELEHAIERACLVCGESILRPSDFAWLQSSSTTMIATPLPAAATPVPSSSSPASLDGAPAPAAAAPESPFSPLEQAEREALRQTLQAHHWNFTRSAVSLGISRSTLYAKANKYGLARNVN